MPLIDLKVSQRCMDTKPVHDSNCGPRCNYLIHRYLINKHSKFLQRMCMPAPAVGALPFAFLTAILSYYHILISNLKVPCKPF